MKRKLLGVIFMFFVVIQGCTTTTSDQVIQTDPEQELKNAVDEASELIKNEKFNDAYWLLRSFEENHEVDQDFETLKHYVQALHWEQQGSVEMQIAHLEKIPGIYTGLLAESVLNEARKLQPLKNKILSEKNEKVKAENEKVKSEAISLINKKQYDEALKLMATMKSEKSDELKVIDNYNGALWSIKHGSEHSLLSELYKIPDNYDGHFSNEIKALKKKYNTKIAEYAASQYRVARYLEKKEPTIGMTSNQVRESRWGSPQKINKLTTVNGTSEQWVYSANRYLYLENDILTAIQE